jgi:hypothetical protein
MLLALTWKDSSANLRMFQARPEKERTDLESLSKALDKTQDADAPNVNASARAVDPTPPAANPTLPATNPTGANSDAAASTLHGR